jgi:hypothetical protein
MPRLTEKIGRQNRDLFHELRLITMRLGQMAGELDRLVASVKKNTASDDSARTMIEGLAEQIRKLSQNAGSGGVDPAELTKLADEIDASTDKMVAAVSANTPAEGGGGGGATPAEEPAPVPPAPPGTEPGV